MDGLGVLATLLGGLGIGSLITTLISYWISNKNSSSEYRRQKKEECYIGILSAYQQAMIEPGERSRIEFLAWDLKVQIFGSKEVSNLVQEFYEVENRYEKQYETRKKLVQLMRKDLEID